MDKRDIEVLGDNPNYWWFRAKRELVESYIQAGDKILNIGCGSHIIEGASNIDDNTWRARPDCMFDLVLMADVLEHIEDDIEFFNTAKNKLKKNGIMIVTVPAHQFLFNNHDKHLNHYRRYNKKTFQKFNVENLIIKEQFYWNTWLSVPMAFYKLLNTKTSDFIKMPKWLNNILYYILRLENRGVRLPFGLTLVSIYEKRN